ncbi:hypothetical protein QBC41DRAFT_351573 [Cercophora samala]|uniref:Uncharacterized protein n=1 Tax=Cercophora samala TaxID=330535 RepID=A0AA39YJY3_9PEZI|nr:hypothetical protein QBC41DRAFT_351573 [Cercophora samala]
MDHNRATLSGLPNELLSMIIEELVDETSKHSGGPAIKACRLVSRLLCEVSSCWLVPSVQVGHSNASLARLDAISRHPLIGRGVRTIEVVLSSYSGFSSDDLGGKRDFIKLQHQILANRAKIFEVGKIITMTEKDSAILRKVHEVLGCWHYIHQEPRIRRQPQGDLALARVYVDRYYGEFQRLAREEQLLLRQGAMGTAVAEALRRMPGVSRLKFDDTCHYGVRRRGLAWETVETVVDGIYENTLLPLTRRDLEARALLPVDIFAGNQRASSYNTCPLSETIPCVLAAVGGVDQAELRSLVVNVDRITSNVPLGEIPDLQQRVRAATRSLTGISMKEKRGSEGTRHLLSLCGTSPDLKAYSVILESGLYALDPLLEGPGSNVRRKDLTVIQVKGASITASSLKQFLDTIPDVLDRVELVGVQVTRGSWREVLDMLREKTYRKTKEWPHPVRISQAISPDPEHDLHSTFEGVFQSDATWEPSDADVYVMRQTQVNPFSPEAGKFPLGSTFKW